MLRYLSTNVLKIVLFSVPSAAMFIAVDAVAASYPVRPIRIVVASTGG